MLLIRRFPTVSFFHAESCWLAVVRYGLCGRYLPVLGILNSSPKRGHLRDLHILHRNVRFACVSMDSIVFAGVSDDAQAKVYLPRDAPELAYEHTLLQEKNSK